MRALGCRQRAPFQRNTRRPLRSAAGRDPAAGDTSGAAVGDVQAKLAANGGPTQTIAPTAGNLAVGLIPDPTKVTAGASMVTLCPATDQRGYITTAGDWCNAGAVQTTATPAVRIIASTPTATYGNEAAITYTATRHTPSRQHRAPGRDHEGADHH
jgi:hypothetical protein